MGSNDGNEEFARKLMPKMVEKILHGPTETSVVIGGSQQNYIRLIYSGLKLSVTRQIVRCVGIVQSQGFFEEIKNINGAPGVAELFRDVVNYNASNRIALQAADHSQNG